MLKILNTLVITIILFDNFPMLKANKFIGILVVVSLSLLIYHVAIRTLATFLYCRISLGIPLSLKQAKEFDDIFTPTFSTDLTWVSMSEIKKLPESERYAMASQINARWKEQKEHSKNQHIQNFKESKSKTKILTMTMYALIIYFIIASFLNLFPANKIAEIYCSIFQTQKIYPALHVLLLVFPTYWIFRLLDKNIK
jgi:hypothetical protein